jgi:hypothetical protein
MIAFRQNILSLTLLLSAGAVAAAADFAVLSPQTWDGFAPRGKEVDAI